MPAALLGPMPPSGLWLELPGPSLPGATPCAVLCRACSLVGCQPGEAIHVGDSLVADINGALQAGLAGGRGEGRP